MSAPGPDDAPVYPLSKQPEFISNLVRLRGTSTETADAFRALRVAADAHSTLGAKERELVLLAGFAATHNEGGFRVHCTRVLEAGGTLEEVEQLVLLLLGTSLGLAPVVETLRWARDELA